MKLTSTFKQGEFIPKKYTCDALDISPPLQISDVPSGAKSLALIVDDPDAPSKTWLHWTVWNIPVDTTDIPEGVGSLKGQKEKYKSPLWLEGTTDFGRTGYGGPCPPSGTHTYRFKLYALDKMLVLEQGATLAQLENAMKGHVIAQAELDGEYKRG